MGIKGVAEGGMGIFIKGLAIVAYPFYWFKDKLSGTNSTNNNNKPIPQQKQDQTKDQTNDQKKDTISRPDRN